MESSLVQAEAWMERASAACLVLGPDTANTQLSKGDNNTGQFHLVSPLGERSSQVGLSGQEAVLGFRGFKEQNWEAISLPSCFLTCRMARCRSTGSSSTLNTVPGPGDTDRHVTASVLKDLTV